MTNSMDEIIIRFGSKRITAEERKRIEQAKIKLIQVEELLQETQLDFLEKMKADLQKVIADGENSRDVSLKEFLEVDKNELSEKEQQVQRVLSFLYHQNASDTPIYRNFPNREVPLIIDCTTVSDTAGVYVDRSNVIKVGEQGKKDVALVEILAHELKHAEHWIDYEKERFNAYQKHQIFFLKEAQAYACGRFVRSLYEKEFPQYKRELTPEEKILFSLFGCEQESQSSVGLENMDRHLDNFLNKKHVYLYKDQYDSTFPILYTDKGLRRIPSAFGIEKKDEVKVLKILNSRVSRTARTADNQLLQASINNDAKKVIKLLTQKNKNGEYMVSDNALYNLLVCECHRNVELFEAVQVSGRLKKEDLDICLSAIFHFSENENLKENEMQERQKVFAKVISLKDKQGNFIFSDNEIREHFEFLEMMGDDKSEALLKLLKPCLKRRCASKPIKSKDAHAM